MIRFAFLFPVVLLAACGSEPEPELEPVPNDAVAVALEPSLPAPNQELFATIFAETCPEAEPVSEALCRRAMGADTVSCEFGVGEDQALRHDARLEAADGAWRLADAPAICAEHDSHHVDI